MQDAEPKALICGSEAQRVRTFGLRLPSLDAFSVHQPSCPDGGPCGCAAHSHTAHRHDASVTIDRRLEHVRHASPPYSASVHTSTCRTNVMPFRYRYHGEQGAGPDAGSMAYASTARANHGSSLNHGASSCCAGHPPSASVRKGFCHAATRSSSDMPATAPPGLPLSGPRAAL